VTRATDSGGRNEADPRPDGPRASTAWSIPEIRIVKDDQGRLRIDDADPATYGAYTARQFLATAKADPKYRDGMTKRPSAASVKITYVNHVGERQFVSVREIFCRMDGDALVLTHFENGAGEKVKDLPITVSIVDIDDTELDDVDRLHELALAELGDEPDSQSPAEPEPEPAAPPPEPVRERRRPSGPLRQYDKPAEPGSSSGAPKSAPAPEPALRSPVGMPSTTSATKPIAGATPGLTVRALEDNEAVAFRALIEAKAGQARWASGLLMQAAERNPGDRKLQNDYLANLLRLSLDPARAESATPLAAALRAIIEEVHAYKSAVMDRDPLKAEKVALQPFARSALATTPTDDALPKTVSGTAQRTPAQVLARLEDPKLARATRVKLLLEVVPELIDTWRPDKESGSSQAGNESSPAVVRRLFSVANEQRQQRKFIDDGPTFKKAGERYAGLERKLPKSSGGEDS
jgi:hypothetical protein